MDEFEVFLAIRDVLAPKAALTLYQVTVSPPLHPTFGLHMMRLEGQWLGFSGETKWNQVLFRGCAKYGPVQMSDPVLRPEDTIPPAVHERARTLAARLQASLEARLLDEATVPSLSSPRARL